MACNPEPDPDNAGGGMLHNAVGACPQQMLYDKTAWLSGWAVF